MNLPLETAKDIRKQINNVGKSYNTEDGQIRWLQDNDLNIHLSSFWSVLPSKVRKRMDNWRYMNLPLKVAKDVRKKLQSIDGSYNTEDGQIRWLQDNDYNIHLGNFWSVIQSEVRAIMDNWQQMNLPFNTAKDLRKDLQNIKNSYNTEDGQIRWLEDNDYDIHLDSFWSVIPGEVRKRMNKWRKMQLPLEVTKNLRKKLKDIEISYNTEDGQIRWLEDNELEINLGHFWTIIPGEIRKRMSKWHYMNLPLEVAIDVRKELKSINISYNTEDGQIRWLEDNGFNLNLGDFWTVIPPEVLKIMNKWKRMNLPLEVTKDIRNELQSINISYNTEDGQIRWLKDNDFEVNLGDFWTVIPGEIRKRVNKWEKMELPLGVAIDIRKKLERIDMSYDTEDGQIRWLEDNEYNINLGQFWSVIPGDVRAKMDNWHKMNLPLGVAKKLRKKLKSINMSYDTEDGQIIWLEDNEYDTNLGHFWSVIPSKILKKMNQWQKMVLPLDVTKDIRKKLQSINISYNTEDGQIRWLKDNGIDINLGHFWTVIPGEIRKRMNKWQKMELPLGTAIDVRKKLVSIYMSYNTEDGQIRWMEDNGYDINLSQFWSVIPSKVRLKMDKWKKMYLPIEVAKDIRQKMEIINKSYNTKDGQVRWLVDNGYDINPGHFWSVIPRVVRKRMDNWIYISLPPGRSKRII